MSDNEMPWRVRCNTCAEIQGRVLGEEDDEDAFHAASAELAEECASDHQSPFTDLHDIWIWRIPADD